jgi:hypothetical protein
MPLARPLAYLWAAPTTALGLALAPVALATGGGARIEQGVLEVHGGLVAWLLRRLVPIRGGAAALTLGHVVLARSPTALAATREHERAHVRQCERWGPLFVPAYLAAGCWAAARGRRMYADNWFERRAREGTAHGAPEMRHE